MNSEIKTLVYQAESRYLTPKELGLFAESVNSMPKRLDLYRLLRDREIKIMQAVADQIETQMPKADPKILELGIKNLILVMRYSAMAILTDNPALLKTRLLDWLEQLISNDMQAVNKALYRLLNQTLKQELPPEQLALLQPLINTAETILAISDIRLHSSK
jgi:Phycobilisome protein